MTNLEKSQSSVYSARSFGAVGDGSTDDTDALQAAIDACCSAGGGRVVLSGGVFLSGTLILRSRLTLEIQEDAVLKAVPDIDRYQYMATGYRSRMDTTPWRAFLFARDEEDISIVGGGEFDGCGGRHDIFTNHQDNDPYRPYGLFLVGCKNVTVKDLEMRNSVFWMQRYLYCDGVRLENLDIWNHSNQNNDGIDIDSSQNVFISNCKVDASDDGICLKSEGEDPVKNVVVTNCIVASHASAIKLGTGSVGGFKNITISNCVIRRSQATEMNHPYEAWGGLVGLDMATVDGGPMRNILFSNISIDGVETPIFVRLGNRLSSDFNNNGYRGQELVDHRGADIAGGARIKGEGSMRGISFSNIRARNVGPIASVVAGYEGNPVRDVTLRDVSIEASESGVEADLHAKPNWASNIYPVNRTPADGHNLPVYGLMFRHVEGAFLDNVRFAAAEGEPRPAYSIEESKDVVVRDIFES